jgi:D-alanine-D-alanine ligase
LAEGTGKGIDAASKVSDIDTLHETCERLLARYEQPVLVEQFLPGREFTVGVLGTGRDAEVIGTLEIDLRAAADRRSYENKGDARTWSSIALSRLDTMVGGGADRAGGLAGVGGRRGGMAVRRGPAHLIEVNPLAGIHPTHSICRCCGRNWAGVYGLIGRIVELAVAD